jgi:hypothetical protein
VPNQRAVAAEERSRIATATGVPWWGALSIALTATLLGIAIEVGSGHRELGAIFAACYAIGCLAAVLAVRRSGIFTAVIQPPLLLFVGVPLAYYLMHDSAFGGLKDILITCGYPLIERFPLMLFTSAAVLLIGLVRRYLVMSAPGRPQTAPPAARRPGLLAVLTTKMASAFAGNGSVDEDPGARPARPRHVVNRGDAKRPPRPQQRKTRVARPTRPPAESFAQFAPDFREAPPRRRESAHRSGRDDEWAPEPRRRSREPGEPRRTPPPPRRERPEYRDQNQRPTRGSRFAPYEVGRDYQSRPPYGPNAAYEPRRRPPPAGAGEAYHPVSRVRYRDSGPTDDAYDAYDAYDADRGSPPRGRPRR